MMNNLEFIDETHTYLYKGVIIPSVSEIVRYVFPNQYKGIPKKTLEDKAKYGTKLHELVEKLFFKEISLDEIMEMNIDPVMKMSIKQAEDIRKKSLLYFKDTEQMICYKGMYAGRYDLKTIDNLICDIKTTQVLHIDNETLQAPLNLQLSLYYLGSKEYQDYGYALHLPKNDIGRAVQVKTWKKEDVIKVVKEYDKYRKFK